jgi:hypothetical protein
MNQTEQEIRNLERELIQAILRRDSGFLHKILADEITVITPHGDLFGKSAMANFDENLVNESIITDEIEVKLYDKTVVVTGRATIKSRYQELDLSGQYRFTRIYLKREDWQIIAYQATRIADSSE